MTVPQKVNMFIFVLTGSILARNAPPGAPWDAVRPRVVALAIAAASSFFLGLVFLPANAAFEGHAIAAALVANTAAFAVVYRGKSRARVVALIGLVLPFAIVALLACAVSLEILATSPPDSGREAFQFAAWLLVYGVLGSIYALFWVFLHGLPVPWLLAAWFCARLERGPISGGAR